MNHAELTARKSQILLDIRQLRTRRAMTAGKPLADLQRNLIDKELNKLEQEYAAIQTALKIQQNRVTA